MVPLWVWLRLAQRPQERAPYVSREVECSAVTVGGVADQDRAVVTGRLYAVAALAV